MRDFKLLWMVVPAIYATGHSQANISKLHKILPTCRYGIGFTAASNDVVKKSKKAFGQKMPWIAAASWSCILLAEDRRGRDTIEVAYKWRQTN